MSNFREKYMYMVSLWTVTISSLLFLATAIFFGHRAGGNMLYFIFLPSVFLSIFLRLTSKPMKREWWDMIYFIIATPVAFVLSLVASSDYSLYDPVASANAGLNVIGFFTIPLFIISILQIRRDKKNKKIINDEHKNQKFRRIDDFFVFMLFVVVYFLLSIIFD